MTDKKTDAKTSSLAKTSIHAIFATDNALEEDGAWVTVNTLTKLAIKVRRTNSDAVTKAADRVVREWTAAGSIVEGSEPGEDQMTELRRRQFADAVLIDWRNLKDLETGEEIPYSRDAAYALLGVKDFIDFVAQAAAERDTFRAKSMKDASGN